MCRDDIHSVYYTRTRTRYLLLADYANIKLYICRNLFKPKWHIVVIGVVALVASVVAFRHIIIFVPFVRWMVWSAFSMPYV